LIEDVPVWLVEPSMSVELYISDKYGQTLVYLPVAFQETAEKTWGAVASRIGLKLYRGRFPLWITPDSVHDYLEEFRSLREALLDDGIGDWENRLGRVIEALEKFKDQPEWTALLG
jgi:hypothetical protein